MAGFEPTTSSSRTKRATKLRHTPREASTAYRTGYLESQTVPAAYVTAREREAIGVSVVFYTMTSPESTGVLMTVLGAFIYLGFFALAALWLFLTAETDQDQLPDRSNSESTSEDSEVSSPWALSQSASK